MLESPKTDRITERRLRARSEILEAAWEIVRAEGLAALSLRDLAARVGMRAPSLYSYFDGKDAIYDAMFAEGYMALSELTDQRQRLVGDAGGRVALKLGARALFEFCTADPARYQLMFQRTIPGWEPTAETYAISVGELEKGRQFLEECGITEAAALDLWTALITGLTDQQISNDPGGDRWGRLLDEAVDMFFDHHAGRSAA
jgi:AcrR family transcriptional regulator